MSNWFNREDFGCWGMACSALVGLDIVGVRLQLQMCWGLDLGVFGGFVMLTEPCVTLVSGSETRDFR